jgi:hypothetical protein
MYSEIIWILIKGLLEGCDKEENVEVTGTAIVSVWKEDYKTFCPMSRIRLETARPAPQ